MYILKGKKYEHEKHKSVETQIHWEFHWRTGSSNKDTLRPVRYIRFTISHNWKVNQQKKKVE